MEYRQWAHLLRVTTIAILVAGIGMVVLGVIFVDPHFPRRWRKMGVFNFYAGWAVIGLVCGSKMIRRIVYRINRHDDPRHAKCPPDAP